MKNKLLLLLIPLCLIFVALGVYSNVTQELAVDDSKIPEKVETNRYFQRWITNLKNKGISIEADDFRLLEQVEIYNTKWMKVYSIDDKDAKAKFDEDMKTKQGVEKIVFSPSEREYIDFRNMARDGYLANEVHFYGQKEDKIIDARILDCSVRANCYFDRAYFLDNDTFVITEVSRNIDKKDVTTPACNVDQSCTYTIKLHFVDLINNARKIYQSKPFDTVLSKLIPNL